MVRMVRQSSVLKAQSPVDMATKGGATRDKTSNTIAMRIKACIVLVAAGLIAAVVMMTRTTSSFGAALPNSNASSAGLMKYITTMGNGKSEEHTFSSPRSRALKVDDDDDDDDDGGGGGGNMNVGQYRRERMEAYLSERAKCDYRSQSTGWVLVDMDANNITYNAEWAQELGTGRRFSTFEPRDAALTMCEVEDESTQSGWIFTRFGPYVGRGGYDWHSGGIHHVPRNPNAKFITAKMFAPITPDGRILGYPPVHAHHVHMNLDGVGHWFDSHGDSICSEEMGGTACYLREQPKGYGFPLLESDEYTLDFIINDVRELGAPALTFYMETSLQWSMDTTLTPVARASVNFHDSSRRHPFSTHLFPLEDSIAWYTGKWLMDGKVIYSPKDQTPWLHSHRSFLKGMWAFAAGPEELGLMLDLLEQTPQESVPASSDEKSYDIDQCWMPQNQDPHEALFDRIKNSKAGMEALRCWLNPSNEEKTLEFVKGTDTSLQYPEAWQQNWEETWYDRVGQVHCDPWSFKKGDNYTVVSINGLRDELADLDKPNLQHIGFKLEYEALDDVIGPNLEVYSYYSDNFGSGESNYESKYILPVSYMNCFSNGEGCSLADREEFAEWYYSEMFGGNVFLECEDMMLGLECPIFRDFLESDATSQLMESYNLSSAFVDITGINHPPFKVNSGSSVT